MSEYYKSLISDEEVIRALVKESKSREGKLPTEATRLKPNLNFFQRTVSHLVSSNKRKDKSQDSFKTEYLKDCNHKKKKPEFFLSKKLKPDYEFEKSLVFQNQIQFVKSSESFNSTSNSLCIENKHKQSKVKSKSNEDLSPKEIKKRKKIANDIRICKIDTDDSLKMSSDEECKTKMCIADKDLDIEQTKNSSNNVICISSDDNSVEVIISSDSESFDIKFRDRRKKSKSK